MFRIKTIYQVLCSWSIPTIWASTSSQMQLHVELFLLQLYLRIDVFPSSAFSELWKITVSFWPGFRHRLQIKGKLYPFQMSHNQLLSRIVDFEKSFDMLNQNAIWSALTCKDLPPKLIKVIDRNNSSRFYERVRFVRVYVKHPSRFKERLWHPSGNIASKGVTMSRDKTNIELNILFN